MRYTRAENWPGYKIVALKSRAETNLETKLTGRTSPPPASYRALGTRSPVCESHRQAEKEYSVVKAMVKAESQRKLDHALKLAQLTQTSRPVCLTNMYVRPGSAISHDWKTMSYPAAVYPESNSNNSKGKRRLSVFDFRKDPHQSKPRPNSAYEYLSGNNRPLFLQNHKSPTSREPTDFGDNPNTQDNNFFYLRDNTTNMLLPLKGSSRISHFSDTSKRQNFVFNYFRREMMREKSIVVPLGSIPATLQVKGNNTRLYKSQGLFTQAGISRSQDYFGDTPLHSVLHEGHRELMTSKSLTTSAAVKQTAQSATSNVNLKSKSPKPAFRDLGVVSEYKLKMASLSTEPKKFVDLPQRPATAAPPKYFHEHNMMIQNKNHLNVKSPSGQDSTMRNTRLASTNNSTCNNTAFGIKAPIRNDLGSDERSYRGIVSNSTDTRKPRNRTIASAGKSPSFIKGVKYGEEVQKKEDAPSEDAKSLFHVDSEGAEGKTELLSHSPRSLTLSVFLPRENDEDPLCQRAISSKVQKVTGIPLQDRAAETDHLKIHKDDSDQKNAPKGFRYTSHTDVLTASTQDGRNQCVSKNSHAQLSAISDDNEQKRRKSLHCELFGPDLCQDCQVQIVRADVQTWQKTVHPHIGTAANTNYLHADPVQRSCPSPASGSDGSDVFGDED